MARVPFRRELERGERVELLKNDRRNCDCAIEGQTGIVYRVDESGTHLILDCGHSYLAKRSNIRATDIERCPLCSCKVPRDRTKKVPWWGDKSPPVCLPCWVSSFAKYAKEEAAKVQIKKRRKGGDP